MQKFQLTSRAYNVAPKNALRGLRLTMRAQGGAKWDEGAAQVQRLLKRDRNNTQDVLSAAEEAFSTPAAPVDTKRASEENAPSTSAATATKVAPPSSTQNDAAPKPAPSGKINPFSANNGAVQGASISPFSKSTSAATPASPFGADFSQTRKPMSAPTSFEPDEMPEDGPWWGFLQNITLTQVAIVASFSLIIALMIATFNVVMGVGAIHFNDIDL